MFNKIVYCRVLIQKDNWNNSYFVYGIDYNITITVRRPEQAHEFFTVSLIRHLKKDSNLKYSKHKGLFKDWRKSKRNFNFREIYYLLFDYMNIWFSLNRDPFIILNIREVK